jgi:hypothetical protein
MLTTRQVDQFIEEGFVRIDNAFPRAIADSGLPTLWKATGCDANDPATWTRPVVRVWNATISFREAANTDVLHHAFDKLVGPGRWMPRPNVGVFAVRFPSRADPGDLGWHIDLSFPPETGERGAGDYSDWRVNVTSRGRALLMLFLFSDLGEDDAPTRIRVGSHRDAARLPLPFGDAGAPQLDLAETGADGTTALATGEAGTVYLCHPFLIHAAQPHRGRMPRFMSQPPLAPAMPLCLERDDGAYSPVETAIRTASHKSCRPCENS